MRPDTDMPEYRVRLAHADSVPVAVVRRVVPASELAKVVPAGCGTVWTFLRAHGLRGGRNIAVYWNGDIRLEVGVEFNGVLPEDGDVVRSATPAGPAVSVTHVGPYQQLGAAHKAIREWCATNGQRPVGPNWEVYGHWQDAWNSDPSQIRTDVFYQVAGP
jgi:effector-binding domain-containing protein